MLHATAHTPPVHEAWPWAGVGQAEPQPPQLAALVLSLTHDEPQTAPLQLVAHVAGEEVEVSQTAPTPAHAVVHEPQWAVVSSAVSHPSVGSPLQSP